MSGATWGGLGQNPANPAVKRLGNDSFRASSTDPGKVGPLATAVSQP